MHLKESIYRDQTIRLAHGNGGRLMRELIEQVFAKHLKNELLDINTDAAYLPFDVALGDIMMTTDGFTVEPLEFPGGNIGSLAVHGTVNDLAVSGAKPLYLTLNAFIEEGFEISVLDRIVASLARACVECGVKVVAGDTKIIGLHRIQVGDMLLLSGTAGDHGTAVLLAREQFGLMGSLKSDAASVLPITEALMEIDGLRFMRDPTRGGVATIAHEISQAVRQSVRLYEARIPYNQQTKVVCDLLGYDPLYMACEGRVLAVVAPECAEIAVLKLHALGYVDARVVGQIELGRAHAFIETELGGERILQELEDDPLPRIC